MLGDHWSIDNNFERNLGTGIITECLHFTLVPALVSLLDIEDGEGTIVTKVNPVLHPHLETQVILGPGNVGDSVPVIIVNPEIVQLYGVSNFSIKLDKRMDETKKIPPTI